MSRQLFNISYIGIFDINEEMKHLGYLEIWNVIFMGK